MHLTNCLERRVFPRYRNYLGDELRNQNEQAFLGRPKPTEH